MRYQPDEKYIKMRNAQADETKTVETKKAQTPAPVEIFPLSYSEACEELKNAYLGSRTPYKSESDAIYYCRHPQTTIWKILDDCSNDTLFKILENEHLCYFWNDHLDNTTYFNENSPRNEIIRGIAEQLMQHIDSLVDRGLAGLPFCYDSWDPKPEILQAWIKNYKKRYNIKTEEDSPMPQTDQHETPTFEDEYYSDFAGDNSHPDQDIPEEREPDEFAQMTADEARQRLEVLKSEWANMAECDTQFKNSWVESHRKEVEQINKIIRHAQEIEKKKREQEKLLKEAEQGLPPRDKIGHFIENLINEGDRAALDCDPPHRNIYYIKLCKTRKQLKKLLMTGRTQTLRDIMFAMCVTSYKGPKLAHRKIYHDDKNGIINRLLDTFYPEDTTPEEPRPNVTAQPMPEPEANPTQENNKATRPEPEKNHAAKSGICTYSNNKQKR